MLGFERMVWAGCGLCFLAACGDGDGDSDDGEDTQTAREGGWSEVLDVPFAAEVENSPVPNVLSFSVGSTGQGGNFMNRGDVEVYYTLPAVDGQGVGRIVVEMQAFTGAGGNTGEEQLGAMKPWIAKGPLKPLAEVDPADRCDDVFSQGCNIAVYYEGLTQPARAGANLRVFLPRNYRGEIDVVTQDNIWPDGTYLERSDVRMVGLYGEASVQLESGRAEVILADDLLPAPSCGDTDALAIEANANCAAFVDPNSGEAAPWDKRCGCRDELGTLKVASVSPEAADVVVDIPSSAWTSISIGNRGKGQSLEDHCVADIACDDFASCEIVESGCRDEEPWKCAAVTNDPGQPVAGLGYRVSVVSAECNDVSFHENPGRYGAAPDVERRGFIEVCSDCLDDSTPSPGS